MRINIHTKISLAKMSVQIWSLIEGVKHTRVLCLLPLGLFFALKRKLRNQDRTY
jgi:hypothetical protein